MGGRRTRAQAETGNFLDLRFNEPLWLQSASRSLSGRDHWHIELGYNRMQQSGMDSARNRFDRLSQPSTISSATRFRLYCAAGWPKERRRCRYSNDSHQDQSTADCETVICVCFTPSCRWMASNDQRRDEDTRAAEMLDYSGMASARKHLGVSCSPLPMSLRPRRIHGRRAPTDVVMIQRELQTLQTLLRDTKSHGVSCEDVRRKLESSRIGSGP